MPNDEVKPQREIAVKKSSLEIKKVREELESQIKALGLASTNSYNYDILNNRNIAFLENRVQLLEDALRSLGSAFMQINVLTLPSTDVVTGSELQNVLNNLGNTITNNIVQKVQYHNYAGHKTAEAINYNKQITVEM